MMPEEDVIALIVKGNSTTAFEFRIVVEERSQHTTDSLTQTSLEIVENHFGSVSSELLDKVLVLNEWKISKLK